MSKKKQKNMPKILWKPIKGFEDRYIISSTGLIKSLDRITYNKRYDKETIILGRIRKFSLQRDGYFQVTLCLNGKSYYKWVHRLVAETFLKLDIVRYNVNHKDGNKRNNNVSNLEWCTDAENNKHAGSLNLKPFGTNHFNSVFSKSDLKLIKQLRNEDLTHNQISQIFNVSRSTVSNFLRGTTYIKETL